MTDVSHAEGGTVLQPQDAGLIVRDGEPLLLIPKLERGDARVPEHVLALTAMYVRWQREPEWVVELAQWFKDQAKSRS